MQFNINGINGDCSFDSMDMRDGLRMSGYATKLQGGSADDAADAMEKIGLIALKYLKVDGGRVNDIAGLTLVLDDEKASPMILTNITLKFMELFNDFL